jgi:putative FmdB family regulatory protein
MERTMPTYEYQCDGCGHSFDELQSFKDDTLKTCPKCKEERLRRLFGTGAAILFKGSGFYETDYRSESYKKAAKADQDSAGKSSETKGTDSATKAKTETPKSETKTSSATT